MRSGRARLLWALAVGLAPLAAAAAAYTPGIARPAGVGLAFIVLTLACRAKPDIVLGMAVPFLFVQTFLAQLSPAPIASLVGLGDDAVLLAAVVAWAPSLRTYRGPKTWIYLLGLFLFAGVAGAIYNGDHVTWRPLLEGAWQNSRIWLLLIVLSGVPWSGTSWARFERLARGGLMLIGASAILNAVAPAVFVTMPYQLAHPGEITGITYHPWALAAAMLVLLVLGLGRMDANPRAGVAALLVSLVGIVLSARLKETVAAVAVAAIWLATTRNATRRIGLITIPFVAAAGVGAVTAVVGQLTSKVSLYFGASSEDTARRLLLNTATRIARHELPFGEGFGRFGSGASATFYSQNALPKYGLDSVWGLSPKQHTFMSDTMWSTFLGETGLAGTAALLLLVAYTVWLLARLTVVGRTGASVRTAAVLLIVAEFVESFGRNSFTDSASVLVLATVVSAALALNHYGARAGATRVARPSSISWGGAADSASRCEPGQVLEYPSLITKAMPS